VQLHGKRAEPVTPQRAGLQGASSTPPWHEKPACNITWGEQLNPTIVKVYSKRRNNARIRSTNPNLRVCERGHGKQFIISDHTTFTLTCNCHYTGSHAIDHLGLNSCYLEALRKWANGLFIVDCMNVLFMVYMLYAYYCIDDCNM